jgi:myo-inositol-1-phosphate synthase
MNSSILSYERNVGVWVIGALGDITTTLICGKLAIQHQLASSTGMISETHPFNELDLIPLSSIVFGGIDIKHSCLSEQAEHLYRDSRTISRETLDTIGDDLDQINDQISIVPELACKENSSVKRSLSSLTTKIRTLIRTFADSNNLNHVIVINLSSAEPKVNLSQAHDSIERFAALIENNETDLITPSILYAYAAFMENCSFIEFTPNTSVELPALQDLAKKRKLLYAGSDGKTGETLLKTALAPMFANRNLKVLSWEGTNMLGNNDGKTLDIPANKQKKLENKGNVLHDILGYEPHSGVSINYVPSLGDWKTAWDLIHFEGFLNVKMSMQFTWQGCDSILAAPLILDMIRFNDFAWRNKEFGVMHQLSSFFKNPISTRVMAFEAQFELLRSYAEKHLASKQSKNNIANT